MASQLTESVDNTLTDTIALTYTESSGVFDAYIFLLPNIGIDSVSHSTAQNKIKHIMLKTRIFVF